MRFTNYNSMKATKIPSASIVLDYTTDDCSSSNFLEWQVVTHKVKRVTFELLVVFDRYYRRRRASLRLGDRPRKLGDTHAVLGCLLTFYRSTMECKDICAQFGIGPTIMSRVIERRDAALAIAVDRIHECRIAWPSKETQRYWSSLIELKYPNLKGRSGFIDGKNYPIQEPTQSELQYSMNNGWLHCVLITGTFLFGVDIISLAHGTTEIQVNPVKNL
jgi:hypothetical protein